MTERVILLTGAHGQLGRELADALAPHGTLVRRSHAELDLGDADAIVDDLRATRPQIIVNAAAYTAVDKAEDDAAAAYAVNAHAPGVLAEEAARIGAVLLHYSTDYVFDGEARAPYDEAHPARPLNVYGASKLAGERAIAAANARALVLRTSWVYAAHGSNFFLTIRKLAAERDELRIVADQVGVPNWARTLAHATARIIAMGEAAIAERSGLYHLTCTGSASWFEFARAIVGSDGATRVTPIATAEFPRPARRPAYGVLDASRFARTFGFALPGWREDLERCKATLCAS